MEEEEEGKEGAICFRKKKEQNSVRQKRRRRRTWSGWKEKRKRGQNPDLLRNTLLLPKRNEDCVDSLSTFFGKKMGVPPILCFWGFWKFVILNSF